MHQDAGNLPLYPSGHRAYNAYQCTCKSFVDVPAVRQ